MSRLDELPPDQSAALSLLLRQRKSYAEVAALLGIAERAVHDRAQAALVMLAPRRARELTPERRLEIGDYLLDQQPGVAERLRTRTYLAGSEPARAWAAEAAAQLAPLAGASLPELPPPAPSAPGAGATAQQPQRVADLSPAASASSPASGTGAPATSPGGAGSGLGAGAMRGSRAGGAVLLAVLAAAVIVAVVLITGGGGSHAKKSPSTTSTAAKAKSGPKVEAQIRLKPSHPGNRIVAVVYVLSEGTKRAFFIAAQNLPETKGFYYAIWLYNSPTSFLALSRSPPVGKSHSLAGGSALPAAARKYHEVLLTEETTAKPSHPGHVVLHAPFKLG